MSGRRFDPAWNHVDKRTSENGGSYLVCKYCDREIKAGVSRVKVHLAGVPGGIQSCPKVPDEVRKEMKEYLLKVDKTKKLNKIFKEDRIYQGMSLESEGHGQNQGRVRGPIDKYLKHSEDEVVDVEGLGDLANIIPNEKRDAVWQEIARFFFDNAIPFRVVDSDSFIRMCVAIARYGVGLKLPSRFDLSNKLLPKEIEHTQSIVNDVKKSWTQTGVSILSDGWKDMRGRQLINFLINSPRGTVFLRSVDASDVVKDANMLFNLLDGIVEEVGEELVVQVVTDNAANYKKAGKMLMAKRKQLWWTPCAAHCIDLILEDIGQLPQHRNALRKAKKVGFTICVFNF